MTRNRLSADEKGTNPYEAHWWPMQNIKVVNRFDCTLIELILKPIIAVVKNISTDG